MRSVGVRLARSLGTRLAGSVDVRLAPGALAAWLVTAWGLGWTPGRALAAAGALWAGGLVLAWPSRGARRWAPLAALAVIVAGAALASAALRLYAVQAGPLPSLAAHEASVELSGRITSDPVLEQGQFGPYVVVTMSASGVRVGGSTTDVRSPLLVIGERSWLRVAFGDSVRAVGRLQTARTPDLSAVLIADGRPAVTSPAGWSYQAVGSVRSALTEAAAPLGPPERGLLPALVDGDVSGLPDQTTADFKTAGLTHLLAVSGSNLTLVLSFVLLVARWLRVRGYGLAVVGVLAVVFFVLLARPQPSVLRAAAMGVVALAGMSTGGRARGVRVLCLAVIVLVIADPWLARSVGFALSTLASGAILVLAPGWRDLLARWLPAPLAEAVAVPLAAQLVCTPVIAAISGQVSLVAVVANMAAAPAVGPATVAGLLAGLVTLVSAGLGHLAGRVAGLPLWWIVEVATHAAGAAGAAVQVGAGAASVAALALLCVAAVVAMPVLLPRRGPCLLASAVLLVGVVHPVGRLGWPPGGWVMVMCDVGQGDGLVLNAGGGAAVVVDTGPDPAAMARCLRRTGVRRIPLIVLTHFHADHITGLPAVLAGWSVGEVETSPYDDPAGGYRAVEDEASEAHVPVTTVQLGERRRVGQLAWQVIGPPAATAEGLGLGEGADPNNASVVMLLHVAGLRVLLAGDAQTEEEDAILASGADVRVDVLKEPHHGSAAQDPRFLAATHAAVSLISVGAGNPYGHPAPQTLSWLRRDDITAYRTDLDGDIAVVVRDGHLSLVTSG